MSTDHKLFAILFADIVGYTDMMHTDEPGAMKVLEHFKVTTLDSVDKHGGHIWQFYGDACLATFDNASDAVNCSLMLQQRFRIDPPIHVRVGIHLGEVVVGKDNIHGDHVNIASRIESMSVPNCILLSRTMAEQLQNKPQYVLKSMGVFPFKNISEPLEVFALANEGLTVPTPSSVSGKFDERKMWSRKSKRIWALVAAFIISVLAFNVWIEKSRTDKLGSTDELKTSLAVFPFHDLSSDGTYKEYAILVQRALHEKLSHIKEINLLSLSGLTGSESQMPTNQEIARKIQPDRYVAGSVLRLENDMRNVQGELVEPSSHQAIWVRSFSQSPGEDLFSVVNPMAENILKEMGVMLDQDFECDMSRVPTSSTKAFGLVKTAVELTELRDRQSLQQAVVLLREAIRLDSLYAEAHAELANTLFAMGWRSYIDRESAAQQAEILAKRAIALFPCVRTANSVLATLAERVYNKNEEARPLYLKAIEVVPNDPSAYRHYSTFLKRNREYKEALKYAKRAADISPLNVIINRNYLDALLFNGFLDEAETYLDSLKRRTPEMMTRYADMNGNVLAFKGQFAEAIPYYEERMAYSNSVAAELGFCYAQTGNNEKALQMIEVVRGTNYEYVNKAMIYLGLTGSDSSYQDSMYHYIDLVIKESRGVNFLCDHPFFNKVPIPVCDD